MNAMQEVVIIVEQEGNHYRFSMPVNSQWRDAYAAALKVPGLVEELSKLATEQAEKAKEAEKPVEPELVEEARS
jgi:hypothetical protein